MPEQNDPQAARESGEPVHRIPRAMTSARSGQALHRIPAAGKAPRAGDQATQPKTRTPRRQHRPDAG